MFRGRFEHSVDAKGRVALPQRFREAIEAEHAEGQLAITRYPLDDCAWVMPLQTWLTDVEPRLQAISQADPDLADVQLVLSTNFDQLPIDKQGRLVLPQFLRRELALEGDVTWVGSGKQIMLWARPKLEEKLERAKSALQGERRPQIAAAMGRAGL